MFECQTFVGGVLKALAHQKKLTDLKIDFSNIKNLYLSDELKNSIEIFIQ